MPQVDRVAFHHPSRSGPLIDESGHPARHYGRRLLLAATVAGMAAIVALPLSLMAPRSVAVSIFATPLVLALVARLRGLPWLLNVAFVLLALVGAALFLQFEPLSILAVIVLFAGPLVGVVAVGLPLREVDIVAAGAFLLTGTVAVVAGFATVEVAGSALLVVGIATLGVIVVAARLLRR